MANIRVEYICTMNSEIEDLDEYCAEEDEGKKWSDLSEDAQSKIKRLFIEMAMDCHPVDVIIK